MKTVLPFLALLAVLATPAPGLTHLDAEAAASAGTGNVIFIHPDGTGLAHWDAARLRWTGPDGLLHWDRLPGMATYRGHMRDALAATSHGGGTTHAYGVKVPADSYGMDHRDPLTSLSGKPYSIMTEALKAGKAVGIVNSGDIIEPGTGCFLASAPRRSDHADIAVQIVESGAQVILSGGEAWLLPEGTAGRHLESGRRTDGRNLVKEAQALGYTTVYDRAELAALPGDTKKVLGVFAAYHTFNDRPEETLAEEGLPLYAPDAPTLGDMTRAALAVLARAPNGFLLVVEEEGTDNFANNNNAPGSLEALRRSDQAIGVARAFLAERDDTLLLTAADSNSSGLSVISRPRGSGGYFKPGEPLPATTDRGAPFDGRDGTATPPFVAEPDARGQRLTFGIAWTGGADTGSGILARADGLNAHLLRGPLDNTDVYRVMYLTLFGKLLP